MKQTIASSFYSFPPILDAVCEVILFAFPWEIVQNISSIQDSHVSRVSWIKILS